MKPQVIEALRKQLGHSKVHTDDDILDERRFDYWVVSHLRDWRGETLERPGVAARPEVLPKGEPAGLGTLRRRPRK